MGYVLGYIEWYISMDLFFCAVRTGNGYKNLQLSPPRYLDSLRIAPPFPSLHCDNSEIFAWLGPGSEKGGNMTTRGQQHVRMNQRRQLSGCCIVIFGFFLARASRGESTATVMTTIACLSWMWEQTAHHAVGAAPILRGGVDSEYISNCRMYTIMTSFSGIPPVLAAM